jgi:hypothetical protein
MTEVKRRAQRLYLMCVVGCVATFVATNSVPSDAPFSEKAADVSTQVPSA